MKYYQLIIIVLITILIGIMMGCEYDVEKPLWERPYSYPAETKITGLEPDSVAPAGVNYIKIHGENFAQNLEDNQVYFSYLDENNNEVVVDAEIVDGSATWLKVRRPTISHNALSVKVVSYDAILVATYPPKDSVLYQIDPSTGVVIRTIALVAQDTGVAWDGKFLWAMSLGANLCYGINPNTGTVQITFATPTGDEWGVTFDGRALWMTDTTSAFIRQVSLT